MLSSFYRQIYWQKTSRSVLYRNERTIQVKDPACWSVIKMLTVTLNDNQLLWPLNVQVRVWTAVLQVDNRLCSLRLLFVTFNFIIAFIINQLSSPLGWCTDVSLRFLLWWLAMINLLCWIVIRKLVNSPPFSFTAEMKLVLNIWLTCGCLCS